MSQETHDAARVRAVLSGRALFVTGGTGFVGKVLVEKLLRSFGPHQNAAANTGVRRVFMLVRPGKGDSPEERLVKEVVQSQVFDALTRELGGGAMGKKRLEELCERVLVPVGGDVTLPGLGIAAEDLQRMKRENVEIIIHCAASVNFDDPLDDAIRLNTEGAMRVLDLAHELDVKALVHVSTAYVNANRKDGRIINEKIYPLHFDPTMAIAKSKARRQDGSESIGIDRLLMKIQGDYPNTYTLTKAMAEVLLERKRKHIPLAIVRPSIVGSSWREPCPGWVDVVSAASAVFMGVCLGVVTMLPGDPRGVAAIVPVDYVANHILLACEQVFGKEGELYISHSCTSTFNPVRWRVVSKSVVGAYQKRKPPVKLTPGPVKFRMLQSRQQFDIEWVLRYVLPTQGYAHFARLSGNKGYLKQADRLQLLLNRSSYLVNLFQPFTSTEFLFDCSTARSWAAGNGPGNRNSELYVDAIDIAWPRYFENYIYGLNRFILKEDLVPISQSSVSHTDLSLSLGRMLDWDPDHHSISFPGVISDISWAYTSSRKPGYTKSGVLGRLMGLTGWREGLAHEAKHVPRKTVRTVVDMKRIVMKTKKVREAARNFASKQGISRPEALARANQYFDEIASTMSDSPPRTFGWALRKVWRQLYEGIRVHEEGIEQLRDLAASAKYPIVLVPTHRSYVDFLLLSFVFFALNLPVPYIAATSDFLNMKGISELFRQSGAFFLRREGAVAKDPLYAAVFSQYLQQLLVDRQIVEYYIEGTRSRSGKLLAPKDGITRMCIEPVLDGRIEDVIFIPISIDYEKPLEATLYSKEMLGLSKTPETTENLMRSIMMLRNNFGHISVQFAPHISARASLLRIAEIRSLQLAVQFIPQLAKPFGYEIVEGFQSAAVCMPIHLVCTLMLMYRHGITTEQLSLSVDWLREEVLKRGGHVACSEGEHRTEMVRRAIKLLGPVVQQRSSPRVIEVAVNSSPKDYLNMIILGYYRNKIVHLFEKEAIWACALYAHWAHQNLPVSSVTNSASGDFVHDIAAGSARLHPQSSSSQTTLGKNQAEPSPDLSAVKKSTAFRDGGILELIAAVESKDSEVSDPGETVDSGFGFMHVSADLSQVKRDVIFLDKMLKLEFTSRSRFENPVLSMQAALEQLLTRDVFQVKQVEKNGLKHELLVLSGSNEPERIFGLLCSIAWPLVDSYFVASSALFALLPDATAKFDTLVQRMSLLAETFYHDRVILHYESCSSGTLQNALKVFESWGVLSIEARTVAKTLAKPAHTETYISVRSPYNDRSQLQKLIDRINFLRGPIFNRNGSSMAASSVADFPMLARI